MLVELQWTYDLLVDAAEFTEMAIEIINETPIEVMGLEVPIVVCNSLDTTFIINFMVVVAREE